MFCGYSNLAGNSYADTGATVCGGYDNAATSKFAVVCGGKDNTVDGEGATISGGQSNSASATASWSIIAGGHDNSITASHATIGGGETNVASEAWATVAGGHSNTASGRNAAVGGGVNNTGLGWGSAIAGGYSNYAAGYHSAIPGGYRDTITADGDYSMAFGLEVYVDDSFYVVLFEEDNPGHLQINRDHKVALPTGYVIRCGMDNTNGNGAYLTGGGVWTDISSRSKKDDLQRLDGAQVLDKIEALELTKWRFTGTKERHIGPMAEDFYRAFGCGAGILEDDSTSIAAMDMAGVSLRAIQELNRSIKELHEVIGKQQKEINELKAEINQLKQ